MDSKSEQFLWDMIDDIREEIVSKFEKGQKEHGGFILDMGLGKLIQAAKDEATDQYTYIYSIEKLLNILLSDPVIAKRAKGLFSKSADGAGVGH